MLEFRHCGPRCRSGEIGRRKGLKIPRTQKVHAGSIPASGTKINALADGYGGLDRLTERFLPHCFPISALDRAGDGLRGGLLVLVVIPNIVPFKHVLGFVP